MKFLVSLLIAFSFLTVGCSSKKVDEVKVSFAEEAGRGVEHAFVSVAEKNLSSEEFVSLSCEEEAIYYRVKVESKLKDMLQVQEENGVRYAKSIAGDACRSVLPFAFKYLLDQGELKPCSREITKDKLLKLGDMACGYLDSDS